MKSTLWALAFACAAVSCSDDFEEPNGGGEGPGLNGETATVKVTVSTDMATKAMTGEEGDDNEKGDPEESKIQNITIFLFEEATQAEGGATGEYDEDANTIIFSKNAKLVAAGFSTVDNTTGTNHPDKHSWEANVQVAVKPDVDLAEKSFGLLAITNLNCTSAETNELITAFNANGSTLTTVSALANYLEDDIKTDKGFIMSTHMVGEHPNEPTTNNLVGLHTSRIKFPKEQKTESDIPSTEVFVERLAAKVRIAEHTNAADYVYTLKDAAGIVTGDKVRLDNAAVINQLATGSYLLKRTTSPEDANLAAELDATTHSVENDVLLGDEKIIAATGDNWGKGNFVIDPWIREKNAATVFPTTGVFAWPTAVASLPTAGNKTLSYGNHIVQASTTTGMQNVKTFGTLDTHITGNSGDLGYSALSENTAESICLAYIRENVTSVAQSKNGFSTGVLFKATYFAKTLMAIAETGTGVTEKSVLAEDYEVTGDNKVTDVPDFMEYKGLKFDSHNAVFAYCLLQQVPEDLLKKGKGDTDYTGPVIKDDAELSDDQKKQLASIFLWDKFKDATGLKSITLAAYLTSENYDTNVDDPYGYLAYVKGIVDAKKNDIDANTTITNKEEEYAKYSLLSNTEGFSLGVKAFEDYCDGLDAISDDVTVVTWATVHESVKEYNDGVCYYTYWIRHEDNGNTNKMGVMEFAIVRNNIYDLAVNSISGLGSSSVDVPKPGKDDEDQSTRINVTVKVRNWVVRKNTDIIL